MPRPVKQTKKRHADASSKKDVDDEDSRGKRKRMSSSETSFEPGNFTVHDSSTSRVNVVVGRGKKLQEFPSVMSSMEKHTTEEILFAHKFLFGNKGSSAKKKELLENLGEFSGYLKKVPKGYDQEKLEKEDEREEVCCGDGTFHQGGSSPLVQLFVWLETLTSMLPCKILGKILKKGVQDDPGASSNALRLFRRH